MDTVERVFVFKDMKSFECSSLSELDRNVFGEQSSLSLPFNATAADDGRPSVPPARCLSSEAVSPCEAFSPCGFNMQKNLSVPVQGMSSTPQLLLQKPQNATGFEQAYGNLLEISWDASLIKSESNSPRFFMESSTQEPTWSPKPQQPLPGAAP